MRRSCRSGLLLAALALGLWAPRAAAQPPPEEAPAETPPPAATGGSSEGEAAVTGDPSSFEIALAVESWRRAWEAADAEAYCAHYAKRFAGRAAYCARKAGIFARSGEIRVGILELVVAGEGPGYRASFLQDYRADLHADFGRKELWWEREEGVWRIVRERWTAQPRPPAPPEPAPRTPPLARPRAPVDAEAAEPPPPPERAERDAMAGSGQAEGIAVLRDVSIRDTGAGAFLVLRVEGEPSVAVTPAPVDGVVRVSLVPARSDVPLLPQPTLGGLIRDLRLRQSGGGVPVLVLELLVGDEPVQVHRPLRSGDQLIVRLVQP